VQKLLQVAVSDLDSGVRKAVLASFCKPSHSVDGFLSQAERYGLGAFPNQAARRLRTQ
jgi:hypothetical protein